MTVTALSIFLVSLLRFSIATESRLIISKQASTVASLSLDCLLHPLDTIKTRIQSREYVGAFRGSKTNSLLSDRRILRGLYQGLGPVLVTSFPSGKSCRSKVHIWYLTIHHSGRILLYVRKYSV